MLNKERGREKEKETKREKEKEREKERERNAGPQCAQQERKREEKFDTGS